MTKVAIMQPTYLPWHGYFGLMTKVDYFVVLDHVQFNKRSWQQRNRIKTQSGIIYLTVPVLSKGKSDQLINNVLINKDLNFVKKHLNSIKHNYCKSDYFNYFFSKISKILNLNHSYLYDLNLDLIKFFKHELQIPAKLIFSSDLKVEGSKEKLLVDICKKIGADTYLSPPGSRDYLNDGNSFKKENISLKYFQYNKVEYFQQFKDFEENLSIIDLMFNCGENSFDVIRKSIVE